LLEAWQLERIKEKVEEMTGRLEVKIYTPETIYRIWYYPPDDIAHYARVVMNEQKHREKSKKAYAHELLEALKNPGTKVRVKETDKKERKWFGREPNMSPIDEIYDYTMKLNSKEKQEQPV